MPLKSVVGNALNLLVSMVIMKKIELFLLFMFMFSTVLLFFVSEIYILLT